MDQRELVRQLEVHFRKVDQILHDHRKKVHEERGAISDEDWWAELIERTRGIRPQMLEVFERNKHEMIAKRFQTVSSEEGFREKMIQRRVMELLPFVSVIRAERGENGDLTSEHIRLASLKMCAEHIESGLSKFEANKDKLTNPYKREMQDLIIDNGQLYQKEFAFLLEAGEIDESKFEDHLKSLVERQQALKDRFQEILIRQVEENN